MIDRLRSRQGLDSILTAGEQEYDIVFQLHLLRSPMVR